MPAPSATPANSAGGMEILPDGEAVVDIRLSDTTVTTLTALKSAGGPGVQRVRIGRHHGGRVGLVLVTPR